MATRISKQTNGNASVSKVTIINTPLDFSCKNNTVLEDTFVHVLNITN
jgi:hypothetical protein